MSVKIRLTKIGKRNQIQYRIVAQDTRTKRDGKFLEILGNFNPFDAEKKLTLKKNEYEAWIKKGAKPTPSLSYLIENGKLPKKAKKVKIDEKTPEPKKAESDTETPVTQNEEAAQKTEAKPEPEQSSDESKTEQVTPDTSTDKQTEKPEGEATSQDESKSEPTA